MGSWTQFVQLCLKFWVKWNITLGSQCTSLLQTGTAKRVETKLAGENASNWGHFGLGGSNKLKCDERPCFGLLCKTLTWTLRTKIHLNVELFNNCIFETLSETLGFVLFIAWAFKGSSTHGNIGEWILENMGIMKLQNWYVYLVKKILTWLENVDSQFKRNV